MAKGFGFLVTVVVVFGLAVGIGVGAWERSGKPSGPAIMQPTAVPGGMNPSAGRPSSDGTTFLDLAQTVPDSIETGRPRL